MNLILNNPTGLWALLGVPAVVLIHFLQRRAQVLPLSTLFLLQQTQRESLSGRRFERLVNSIPLWLQILAVLLLAWLLAEPRYRKADTTQQVALVIDSSASMQVFKDTLLADLETRLPALQGQARKIDLTLLDSDPSKPPLYTGSSIPDALQALQPWIPHGGAGDPALSLQLARSRVRRDGVVAYLTDTPRENLPFNALCIALGESRPNCGLTGVSFQEKDGSLLWRALVRNYSDQPQTRQWTMTPEGGQPTAPRPLVIPADGIASIQGPFPKGTARLKVQIEADAFPLDDTLPLVRPAPKPLLIANLSSRKYTPAYQKILRLSPALRPPASGQPPDCTFASYDPLSPALPDGHAIIAIDETTQGTRHLRGGIVAEKHPLTDGLNFQPLLVREALQIERLPSDQVLLWQGDRPLVFLRTPRPAPSDPPPAAPAAPARQLVLNFDLTLSNALRLPATAVLLHRFTTQLRDQKIAPQSLNAECGQPLRLAFRRGESAPPLLLSSHDPDGQSLGQQSYPLTLAGQLRAPARPGFFTVTQPAAGENSGESPPLLTASAHFADTREADLRSCATAETSPPSASSAKAIDRHTYQDHLWRLWLLLLLAALLLAWHHSRRPPAQLESPA